MSSLVISPSHSVSRPTNFADFKLLSFSLLQQGHFKTLSQARESLARLMGYRHLHEARKVLSAFDPVIKSKPRSMAINLILDKLNDSLMSKDLQPVVLFQHEQTRPSEVHDDANSTSGLYVLFFKDGDSYVGQNQLGRADKRHSEHRKWRKDIIGVSYSPASDDIKTRLAEENNLRAALVCEGFVVRGHPSVARAVEKTFSNLLSDSGQTRFFRDLGWNDISGSRPELAERRQTAQEKYDVLANDESGRAAIEFVSRYIYAAIPTPSVTEYGYYAATCLPTGRGRMPGYTLLTRLNVFKMEVFNIRRDILDGNLFVRFFVSKSILEEVWGEDFDDCPFDADDIAAFDAFDGMDRLYECGGDDQIAIDALSLDIADKLIVDPVFRMAMRTFNVRLMRLGPCPYRGHHSPQLVDAVFTNQVELAPPKLRRALLASQRARSDEPGIARMAYGASLPPS